MSAQPRKLSLTCVYVRDIFSFVLTSQLFSQSIKDRVVSFRAQFTNFASPFSLFNRSILISVANIALQNIFALPVRTV